MSTAGNLYVKYENKAVSARLTMLVLILWRSILIEAMVSHVNALSAANLSRAAATRSRNRHTASLRLILPLLSL